MGGFYPHLTRASSNDGAFNKKNPADAVCCKVLNLLSQVRALPGKSALAEAYRIFVARSSSIQWVLAQYGGAASRASQGNFLIP